MDQSDLEDQFFDENGLFYDIKKRNELIFKAAEANDNNGFKGIKAEEAKEEAKEEKKEEKAEEASEQKELTQTEIMKAYRELKKTNPKLSFQEFCIMIANGYVAVDKEGNLNEEQN